MSAKKPRLDFSLIMLMIGVISYYVIRDKNIHNSFYLAAFPVVCYCQGKRVVNIRSDWDSQHIAERILLLFGFGLYISSLLNAMEYFEYKRLLGYGIRHWPIYWSRHVIPATQHVFYCIPILACGVYALCEVNRRRIWCSALILIASIESIWFSYISLSRTSIVVAIIVNVLSAIVFVFINNNYKKYKKQLVIVGGISILLFLIVGLEFVFDVYQIRSSIMTSSMWARNGGILHNIRFVAQKRAFQQLFSYPMGGRQMELAGLNYAHNMWLDVANEAGLIPFFAFVLFTITAFVELIKHLMNKQINTPLKMLVTATFLAYILYNFVEPTMDSWLSIAPWCMTIGLIKGLNESKIEAKNS